MDFAKRYLSYSVDKGLDLVAKSGKKYVIGEAKFLTDYGGHQNAQLRDAIGLLNEYRGEAVPVAILDGVVWIENGGKMLNAVRKLEETALSSLLLKDFLESL